MDYIVGLLNLNMLHVVPPCPHMWDIFHEDIDKAINPPLHMYVCHAMGMHEQCIIKEPNLEVIPNWIPNCTS